MHVNEATVMHHSVKRVCLSPDKSEQVTSVEAHRCCCPLVYFDEIEEKKRRILFSPFYFSKQMWERVIELLYIHMWQK